MKTSLQCGRQKWKFCANGTAISNLMGKMWSTSEGRPLVPENSQWICVHVPFEFQPVEPKILPKWKLPDLKHRLSKN